MKGGTVGLLAFKTKVSFDNIVVTTDPLDDQTVSESDDNGDD